MAGDVETRGDLTLGATVFDRRPNSHWHPNMDVATDIDSQKVFQLIIKSLGLAGTATK